MGKFKEWCKQHKSELVIYGLEAVIVGASIGIGAKIGYNAGTKVGFKSGKQIIPLSALKDNGLTVPGGTYWMVNWANNAHHQIPEDLAQMVVRNNGELDRTVLVAVTSAAPGVIPPNCSTH